MKPSNWLDKPWRHCEERSDAAIQLECFAPLARTGCQMNKFAFAALPLALLAACTTTPGSVVEQPTRTAPPPLEIVQILAINDFHGNLEPPKSPIEVNGQQVRLGGVAHISAKLAALRKQGFPTITVSAGDLIGASPLASA